MKMLRSELSNYTITIYELMEQGFDFGLKDYEIFDENYRETLNNAILNAYMFREICDVNPNIWKFKLNKRLDLIMRNRYNELYKAKSIEFNALYNVDMTETYEHTIDNSNSNTTTTTSSETNKNKNTVDVNDTNKINNTITTNGTNSEEGTNTNTINNSNNVKNSAYGSDMPSDNLIEEDFTNNIFINNLNRTEQTTTENNTTNNTLSNSTEINQEQTTTGQTENTNKTTGTSENTLTGNNSIEGSATGKTVESYTRHSEGSSAGLPFSKAMIQLKEFYDTFNLDELVINELKDLFIQVW